MLNAIKNLTPTSWPILNLPARPSPTALKVITAATIGASAIYLINRQLKALGRAINAEYFKDAPDERLSTLGFRPPVEPDFPALRQKQAQKQANIAFLETSCDKAGLVDHSIVSCFMWENGIWVKFGEEPKTTMKPNLTRLMAANLSILSFQEALPNGYLQPSTDFYPDFLALSDSVDGHTLEELPQLAGEDISALRAFFTDKIPTCPEHLKKIAEDIARHGKILRDDPKFLEVFFALPLPRNPPTEMPNGQMKLHIPDLTDYPE